MAILDKLIAAVTPPESDEARAQARERATSYVDRAPWLSDVLDHHRQIDAAFAAVHTGATADERRSQMRKLAELLTGHAMAEEAVIYPALSDNGETGHATMAYTEQSAAKMQMGLLEHMDPMTQDFEDKLGHLEGAVKHHVYQEEGSWFIELIDAADSADHAMISRRYSEEFNRYMGGASHQNSHDESIMSSPNSGPVYS